MSGRGLFDDLGSLERIDSPAGRKYRIPGGKLYPSVTTVLDGYGDNDYLDVWRSAVGEEAAKYYSDAGKERGTWLHKTMEKYVEAESDDGYMEFQNETQKTGFISARAGFLSGIEHVYGQELFLYSDELLVAGATDVVGVWKGMDSIVDFKTSSAYKNADDIMSYWMQTTMYSLMVEERIGLKCENLVIVMALVNDPVPLVYTRRRTPDLIDRCREAREIYGVSNEKNT